MEYYIGQIFEGTYPPEAASWCNSNNAYIGKTEDNKYEIKAIPELQPTYEEQKEKRAEAYRIEVDPITSQISRLRDEEQTTEIIEEINKLLQKRNELVIDIQERYPYPEEE